MHVLSEGGKKYIPNRQLKYYRQDELKYLSKAYHLETQVIIVDIRYNSHCITIIKLVFFFLPV